MTELQKKAWLSRTPMPHTQRTGGVKIALSVMPADNRPTKFAWAASVSGLGDQKTKQDLLRSTLSGVGDSTTDYLSTSANATYLMRDFTTQELSLYLQRGN